MKSIFVSHKYEDNGTIEQLKKWEARGLLGDVRITGETKDVRIEGINGIKNHLNPQLKGAGAVIVLVGDDTHTSKWVEHEIQHAKSHNKKIIPVRIAKTVGSVPKLIKDIPTIPFEANAIKNSLE